MKFLAWCLSWICYGIGNFFSFLMDKMDFTANFFYPPYNKLMSLSMRVSDRYDLGIWKTRQDRIREAVETLEEALDEDDDLTEEVAELVGKIYARHQEQFAIAKTVAKEIMKKSLPYYPNIAIDLSAEPGITDKTITPTLENTFQEVSLTDEDYKNDVIFQIGRAYRHSGGGEIFIVGRAETTLWGKCLIAEEAGSCHLKPVGENKDAAVNWKMIPLSEWMKNFS